jgi:hypothetical protein
MSRRKSQSTESRVGILKKGKSQGGKRVVVKSPEAAERYNAQKTVEKVSMINLERVEMVK